LFFQKGTPTKKKGNEYVSVAIGSQNSAKFSSASQKLAAALNGEYFSKVAQLPDVVSGTFHVVVKYPKGVIGLGAKFSLLHIEIVQYFNGERNSVWYMNTGSSFTALQTVDKSIMNFFFHTSVVCDRLNWLDQFETRKDAFRADVVKKSGAFNIKHFGSSIAVPKSED
jgi:hypothetical protein